jgi:isocitrate dehydrogenase
MVIFRENTEDIYAGIEFEHGSEDNKKFKELFKQAFPKAFAKIRFPETRASASSPCRRKAPSACSRRRSNTR